MMHTHPIRAAVFDIDGTLAMMDKKTGTYAALPGAVETLEALRARDMPVVAYTNGTFFPPAHYYPRLADAGLHLDPGHILTPAVVAARQLVALGHKRPLVLGAEGTRTPLRDLGLDVAVPGDAGPFDSVMLGWMADFGARDLEVAAQAIWSGLPLYATSVAPYFAGANGRLLGISGAIAAALQNATGVAPIVFGKPEPIGLIDISNMLSIPPDQMVVIGDDPRLEIAMARRAGAFAVGVTTGMEDAASFASAPEDRRAQVVLPSLEGLVRQPWFA
jgi:4-nitrophenyl phosphatase